MRDGHRMGETGNLSASARPGIVRPGMRRAVGPSAQPLVRLAPLDPATPLPVVATPTVADVDLASWSADNRDSIEECLHTAGGLLLRGFGVDEAARFEGFMAALYPNLVT